MSTMSPKREIRPNLINYSEIQFIQVNFVKVEFVLTYERRSLESQIFEMHI